MNGGEAIFLDHALRDQNRVLEVVAVPGHEGHQQVLTQGELAQIRRGAIRQHVAALDRIAGIDQRPLIDAGVLVRARVLGERIDVDARFAGRRFIIIHAHHDARSIDRVDAAAAPRHHGDAGVDRHRAFHAGAHQAGFPNAASEPPGAACSIP